MDSSRAPGEEASQLLNEIVSVKNYLGKYLEIEVEKGLTFEGVNIKDRYAVNPHILLIGGRRIQIRSFFKLIQVNSLRKGFTKTLYWF